MWKKNVAGNHLKQMEGDQRSSEYIPQARALHLWVSYGLMAPKQWLLSENWQLDTLYLATQSLSNNVFVSNVNRNHQNKHNIQWCHIMTNKKNLENFLSADPKICLHWFFFFCLEIACNKIVGEGGGGGNSRPEKCLRWGIFFFFFCWKLPETGFRTKIGGLYFFSKMASGGHLGSQNAPKNNRRWDLATIYAHTKYENNRFKFVTCRVHTRKCLRTRTRNDRWSHIPPTFVRGYN